MIHSLIPQFITEYDLGRQFQKMSYDEIKNIIINTPAYREKLQSLRLKREKERMMKQSNTNTRPVVNVVSDDTRPVVNVVSDDTRPFIPMQINLSSETPFDVNEQYVENQLKSAKEREQQQNEKLKEATNLLHDKIEKVNIIYDINEHKKMIAAEKKNIEIQQNQANLLAETTKKLETQLKMKNLQPAKPEDFQILNHLNETLSKIDNNTIINDKDKYKRLLSIILDCSDYKNAILTNGSKTLRFEELAESFDYIKGNHNVFAYKNLGLIINKKYEEFKTMVNSSPSYFSKPNYYSTIIKLYGLLIFYIFIIYKNEGLKEVVCQTENIKNIRSDLKEILSIEQEKQLQQMYKDFIPKLKTTINNLFIYAERDTNYLYTKTVDKKYLKQSNEISPYYSKYLKYKKKYNELKNNL